MNKKTEVILSHLKINVLVFLGKRKTIIIILSGILASYLLLIPGKLFQDPVSTVILDKNGILLGARVAEDGQWRFPPELEIPEKVARATMAYEDRYYYFHPGVNPVSLVKALFLNIKKRKIVSGGSTITMQTIRLSRKGRKRTIWEKTIEIVLATRLELSKSKKEILSLYLNNAPYGGNVVGIEAASWRYFSTSSNNLSWAEAATLAVLPNTPSLVHPGRNREILLRKRNNLLQKLYKLNRIDQITLTAALAEKIPLEPAPMPKYAPHLLDRLSLNHNGEICITTIEADLQSEISVIAERHHQQLQYNEIHNLAVLVIEVETGDVLAYIGNSSNEKSEDHGNEVDIIRSRRSTGSLLKPLLYTAMLDDGKILPNSLITDVPVNLNGFAPQNFEGGFEGAVPASRALSRSLNVPAVQMLTQYGVERFRQILRQLGMKTIDKSADYYGLSLILGGAEGTLEEMTNIYAGMSRILNHYSVSGLYYSSDIRGLNFLLHDAINLEHGSNDPQIFNAASIWCTYKAMTEVNRPMEESNWMKFESSTILAWKTGTSFGFRDGWAIGTTSEYVVGVWVGNADGEGRPGLTGAAVAAPIMFDVFKLLPKSKWFEQPLDELSSAVLCSSSGFLAGINCPEKDTVLIPRNGINSMPCPYHHIIHLTKDKQYRVSADCYPVDSMVHVSWFVLPPLQEWYYKKRYSNYEMLPPFKAGCEPVSQKSMEMVYPRGNIKVYIPKELGGHKGRIIFEAVHSNDTAIIYWHIDNQFITATQYIHQIEVLPRPGKHKITLIDAFGEELVSYFEAVGP